MSVNQSQILETSSMKTFLGSLLASLMQALETGCRAHFVFSERDARMCASGCGFPSPEKEDLQETRRFESASPVSIPRNMKLSRRLTPPYGPIPLGMHPELMSLTLGAALRKRPQR
jgi:hypothetical protein